MPIIVIIVSYAGVADLDVVPEVRPRVAAITPSGETRGPALAN
jgi:hypothetical protein